MPSMKVCISCGRGIPMDASRPGVPTAYRVAERRRHRTTSTSTTGSQRRRKRQASEAAGRKAPS